MDKQQAQNLIKETFENPFEKDRFSNFIKNLLNQPEDAYLPYRGNYIPDAYKHYILSLERLYKYSNGEHKIDILVVQLKKETSLERARTMQRNFIAWYLNGSRGGEMKDAALVAFVAPGEADWRFSLVKMDYRFEEGENRKVKVKEEFTPARRWSFLVGSNEASHTAQSRLVPIVADDEHNPTLKQLENAFDIETVSKEFFLKYRDLFIRTKEELDKVVLSDAKVNADFEAKGVDTVNFAKKLLGQIVFLYFLQKKGWFGVGRDAEWGTGSKKFLRELFTGKHGVHSNFYNDILEPLFYEALRIDRRHDDDYYSRFNCKIPFLNGGLFDPIGNYDWVHTDIIIPNELFSNNVKTKEGDTGNGILDIFDRYNFTVKEDEPLEKEVAIDPELLGKAYEKFNAIRPDNYAEYKTALKSGQKGAENKFNKKFGVYYTPREIVHYMCQQSLINYLHTDLSKGTTSYQKIGESQTSAFGNETKKGQFDLTSENRAIPEICKEDIETLIKFGDQLGENEAVAFIKGQKIADGKQKTTKNKPILHKSIKENAKRIDDTLANITVCDPAVGSGAFPVGMMHEMVKTRNVLSAFIKEPSRTVYNFKRQCIEKSLYGVDIDPGAVEIAKLRLWLSLVVDEEDIRRIKPLPNLDYKIVCGNSLLGVEKDLFNNELFTDLERLKPLYFDETNPTKKQEYKKQIDDLISQITNGHQEFDFEVYFSEVFHEKGGFDVVIANPPYVGEKGYKEIFQRTKKGMLNKFYQRKMDIFYFFFHQALNLGKQRSSIAFITTNYYPTATGGTKLRQDFKKRAIIKNLINFNELKIFESALGQHNMITVLEKVQDESRIAQICITQRHGASTSETLQQILNGSDEETNYYKIVQKDIYDGNDCYIRMVGGSQKSINSIQIILEKLKTNNNTLGHICNVNQGILTGADKVSNKHIRNFPKEAFLKGDGIYVLNDNEIKYIVSKEIIKPWFKNSSILKYYTKLKPDDYLLYLTRDINLSDYIDVQEHIKKYEKIIKSRPKDRGEMQAALKLGKWWVVFATRKNIPFNSAKIVVPQRSLINTFGYNEVPWYASADVYFITEKQKFISIKYILALLNSKLYYLWLYYRGKRKGEMLELYQKPLSEIPIKKISKDEQKPFIKIVDKVLAISKSDDYLNNSQKQAKVKVLEQEIDQMVYQLYGLTEEEIAIVEGRN